MVLQPGTKLGTFEITGMLGKGGMGEVYRATDSKLGREVAIKVLPDVFAIDAERMSRFEREARVLATLDHPNIGALYEFQEAEGHHFLVMQLIEGETLSDRIAKGAIPVEEALPLFAQIAEALEAAHAGGIVHRDLKPANIKIDENGNIKVLDFGLAMNPDGEVITIASPTDETKPGDTPPSKITMDGAIIGTPAYMSPEQARGKEVDKRCDIWAFGCCFYEALTGKMPFDEPTISDTLASVLKLQVDLDSLPNDTPWKIRELIESCLEKDVQYRLRDIGDAWKDLKRLTTDSGRFDPDDVEEGPSNSLRFPIWTIAIVAMIFTGVGTLLRPGGQETLPDDPNISAPQPEPLTRFSLHLDTPQPAMAVAGGGIVLSPDGTTIVYTVGEVPNTHLESRKMDELEAEMIQGSDGAAFPFFSPDGKWVGFSSFSDSMFKKIPVDGGNAIDLCRYSGGAPFANWGNDGYVYIQGIDGLERVSESGGELQNVTTRTAEELYHVHAHTLPGGKALAYTTWRSEDEVSVALHSFETEKSTILIDGGWNPMYLPSGHLIYGIPEGLMAVPFDVDRLEITGEAVPVGESRMLLGDGNYPWSYTVSQTGSLAFVVGNKSPENFIRFWDSELVWVNRAGDEEPLSFPEQAFAQPRISPDGSHVALSRFTGDNRTTRDIWIYNLTTYRETRFTFDNRDEQNPIWSPDGARVVYRSRNFDARKSTLMWKPSNGTGNAQPIPLNGSSASKNFVPMDWTNDGTHLVAAQDIGSFTTDFGKDNLDFVLIAPDSDEELRQLIVSDAREERGRLSPNGKWIAYVSLESGEQEVYVQSFPEMEGKWQISIDGGQEPIWSPDGTELFYRKGGAVMTMKVETDTVFSAGVPEELFAGDYLGNDDTLVPYYDVARDGERFLMLKRVLETGTERDHDEIVVVLNWLDEVARLAPIPKEN